MKWELTAAGIPHVHMYLLTDVLFRSSWIKDVLRKNDNNRIEIKRLHGLAVNKWQNYCKKDVTTLELDYYSQNNILPLTIHNGI